MPVPLRRATPSSVRSLASLAVSLVVAACGATPTPSPRLPPSLTPGPTIAIPMVVPTPTPTAIPVPTPRPVPTFAGRFPGGLMIADRENSRIIVIDEAGTIHWQFPGPAGFLDNLRVDYDDAFLAPDGKTITANDEDHQIVDRIDIASQTIIWRYGHYNVHGRGDGYLWNPDDAYPLANGDVLVADIVNCRVIEITPAKEIVKQWGKTGVCSHDPPNTYSSPNGDTPLPDGGLLITEIGGSHVVRLAANGDVLMNIKVPVSYPSDAQLDQNGNVIVTDYANPGAVVCVSPEGKLMWRYGPTSGAGRLAYPSFAFPLPDGTVTINDDLRQRMVLLDPRTMTLLWQYGHTDVSGSTPGYLHVPDGHDVLPPGVFLP